MEGEILFYGNKKKTVLDAWFSLLVNIPYLNNWTMLDIFQNELCEINLFFNPPLMFNVIFIWNISVALFLFPYCMIIHLWLSVFSISLILWVTDCQRDIKTKETYQMWETDCQRNIKTKETYQKVYNVTMFEWRF